MRRKIKRWTRKVEQLVLSITWPWERRIERRWKEQKGLIPGTNDMWLTPRMKRRSRLLQRVWEEQDRQNAEMSSERSEVCSIDWLEEE